MINITVVVIVEGHHGSGYEHLYFRIHLIAVSGRLTRDGQEMDRCDYSTLIAATALLCRFLFLAQFDINPGSILQGYQVSLFWRETHACRPNLTKPRHSHKTSLFYKNTTSCVRISLLRDNK